MTLILNRIKKPTPDLPVIRILQSNMDHNPFSYLLNPNHPTNPAPYTHPAGFKNINHKGDDYENKLLGIHALRARAWRK